MKSNLSKIPYLIIFYGVVVHASYTTPSDAYKAAINNSTKILSSKYQYESKEEGLEEIYAKLYPQVDSYLSYGRNDYKINELQSRNKYDVKEESNDYGVTLNQVIYDPVLFSQIDVEESRLKVYSYDLEISKQELASETLDSYMNALNSKNKIALLKSNLDYVSQNLKMIEEKYSMNLVSKMDYLKVNVEYQKSKIALKQEEKKFEVVFQKLKDITKLKDIEIPDINFNSFTNTYVDNILNIVNNNSNIDKNFNILQSRVAVEMSTHDVKNAEAGHLPSLGFNASYTAYDTEDETVDYENYSKAMLKLRIPIFQGGAVSSKIKSKQLAKKAIQENLRTIEDETTLNLNENINNLKYTVETIKMYKDALTSGEIYLESIQLAYDNGLKSIVELYDAKNKLFEIKYEYIKSIHEMSNAYVKFLILTNNLDKLDLIDNIVSGKE